MLYKPTFGRQLDLGHPLADGLVACLPFNEGCGRQVYDLSGNGGIGTITGVPFPPTSAAGWNPGENGPIMRFNKGADTITIATNNLVLSDATDKTVVVDFCFRDHGSYGYNIIATNGPLIAGSKPTLPGWLFWSHYVNNLFYFSVAKSNAIYVTTPPVTLVVGNSYRLVGVFVKATAAAYLYANGILIGSATNVNVDAYAGSSLRISAVGGTITGDVGSLLTYNRAATPAEIQWLTAEPFAMFDQRRFWAVAAVGHVPYFLIIKRG